MDHNLQFGMPTLIENQNLLQNINLCKKLGLNFIELNMNFPEYQIDQLEQYPQFMEAAQDAGIYYTIHLDEALNIADFNPLVKKAYLETVRKTIEVAKTFVELKNWNGQKNQPLIINMHMNHGIFITLPDRKVQMYERDFPIYENAFLEFCHLCEEWIGNSDIKIAIENTDGFKSYEKFVIQKILKSEKFCLTWDIGHSKAAKNIDEPFILENQENLLHFHIHDGKEEPAKNHLALGDGDINIEKKLSLAKERNARCVLETKTVAALEASVNYLISKGFISK